MTWQPREKYLHEKVFDTLSRPLSRAAESRQQNSPSMGVFSGRRVKWNHFGKKFTLRISDYEMDYANIYEALLKKIYEAVPNFDGNLAYIDLNGRQVVIADDAGLRHALQEQKNKLKIHTTVRELGVLAAADMVSGHSPDQMMREMNHRPARSQSVPPERSYTVYPPNHSPSSMESAPPTYRNRVPSPPAFRNRVASPPPSTHHISRKTSPQPAMYPIPPPGYGSTFLPQPYSQSIQYGMPPHSGMLLRFLANPFPFGHYHRSWIGPNKYHNWGHWGHKYYSSGWGPVW